MLRPLRLRHILGVLFTGREGLYSPSASNHCLSPTTEPVRDVAAANFCEEFDFTTRAKAGEAAQSAKKKFDDLFGGK
jgi:hypothetical protein